MHGPSSLLVALPFLSSCARHHRHLHSFPTRRSSDLHHEEVLVPAGGHGGPDPAHRLGGFDDLLALQRSEEHTSELQSRGHLVCRLLLEKKNARERTSRTVAAASDPHATAKATPSSRT